jgi:hypothetical protein
MRPAWWVVCPTLVGGVPYPAPYAVFPPAGPLVSVAAGVGGDGDCGRFKSSDRSAGNKAAGRSSQPLHGGAQGAAWRSAATGTFWRPTHAQRGRLSCQSILVPGEPVGQGAASFF